MWDIPEEDGRIPSEMEWVIYLSSDDVGVMMMIMMRYLLSADM
jgi:hypothetical protein